MVAKELNYRTDTFFHNNNFNSTDFFVLINELILTPKMQVRASESLHSLMLSSILRSNMSFFESTPIGRILNRFSKDMNAIEFQLPMSYKDFIYCGIEVFMIATVITISTPYILIVLVPLAVIYFCVQRLYVASCSKLKRLDSASKSPIFSHFGETLTGISTIRAYNAQNRFIQMIEQRVDENNQYGYPLFACSIWLGKI